MTDTGAPAQTLLPPNTTALDRALEQVTAPRLSPTLLRTTYDPATLPVDFLPWLAWGENVPVWPQGEAQQRDIIRRSHRLHGIIGTAAGLRAAARLTGAEVTRLISPPAKTFLGGWSEDARQEWLSAHPQLRLYPYRQRATAQGILLSQGFLDDVPVRTDALFRSTTRATLWYPSGQEIDLTTREWQLGTAQGNASIELARHDTAPGLHCGQPLDGHTAKYTANHRLWHLDQRGYRYGTATLHIRTTSPSLAPLSSDVDIVAESASRPGASLFGTHLGNVHTCNLDGETRYYRRTYLHDPGVQGRTTASPGHLGATRLGMPPFHVEARVRMPPRSTVSLHCGGHIGTAQPPLNRKALLHMTPTLNALDWMRAEADKILIDTRQSISLRARQTVIAGTVTAGQILDR